MAVHRATVMATVMACAMLLKGCATAPDSELPKPTVAIPASFDAVPEARPTSEAPQNLSRWWDAMQDPVLTQLVDQGLAANSDVRVALDRLKDTRAYQTVGESAMYPTIEAAGWFGKQKSHTRLPGILPTVDWPTSDGSSGGLVATWELDFLGKRRHDAAAVREGALAAQEGVYGAQLMVSSDIANNYFEARGIEQRLALLQRGIRLAQRTHDYATGRFNAGQATHADVDRAQSQIHHAMSQVAPLKALLEVRLHRLAVLTGRPPQTLQSLPPQPASSRLPASLPQTLPSEVLEQRPDVRAAAHMLRSQANQLGAARADLLPKFYLGFLAQDGHVGVALDGIPHTSGDLQAIGLGIRLPIFSAGRLRAKIVQQEAQLDAREAEYERAILQALEDVENAYTGRMALDQSEGSLTESVRLTRHAAEHLEAGFLGGQGLLLPVLETQAVALQREDELVQTRTLRATTTVLLYKALGGGWTPEPPASPATPAP